MRMGGRSQGWISISAVLGIPYYMSTHWISQKARGEGRQADRLPARSILLLNRFVAGVRNRNSSRTDWLTALTLHGE
jgi:hypothetical protein